MITTQVAARIGELSQQLQTEDSFEKTRLSQGFLLVVLTQFSAAVTLYGGTLVTDEFTTTGCMLSAV
jgi:hypothetical protein